MYISVEQVHALDVPVKDFEVALRSYVAETLITRFPTKAALDAGLASIVIPQNYILSQKMNAKVQALRKNSQQTFEWLTKCHHAYTNRQNVDVAPFVSELIDLIFLNFNTAFATGRLTERFLTVDDFHYSCTLYHKVRNSMSHPATSPIHDHDAEKVLMFLENIAAVLEDKYFWYVPKNTLAIAIKTFRDFNSKSKIRITNLQYSRATHKNLLCREDVISDLYLGIVASDRRLKLAGSTVVYGYGGVGKTAIVTEFLLRLLRDKKDGLAPEIEYLLFYSSKDEFLRANETTGQIYVDSQVPAFATLEELKALIARDLKVASLDEIGQTYVSGIIAVDNLENLSDVEQKNIIDFTKTTPRSMQFIVTSRNEENCEEKLHIQNFTDEARGIEFVRGYLDSENLGMVVSEEDAIRVFRSCSGNALVILQVLNLVSAGAETIDSVLRTIDSYASRNSETIAGFMFKNSFERVISTLDARGLKAAELLQIVLLYNESIEMYSLSKLTGLPIDRTQSVVDEFLKRLILEKKGEYIQMNDFAARYVVSKLMVSAIERRGLLEKIREHKIGLSAKLSQIDSRLAKDRNLQRIVDEWKPSNYLDQMTLFDIFLLYHRADSSAKTKNKSAYLAVLAEAEKCSLVSGHPNVYFQLARIRQLGYDYFFRFDESLSSKITQSFETAIEAIQFDYRFLLRSPAHISLLTLFAGFLMNNRREFSRALFFLEEASSYLQDAEKGKVWFICHNWLCQGYFEQGRITKNKIFEESLVETVKKVLKFENELSRNHVDIRKFRNRYFYLIRNF